jgi:transcriptional antiterminator NusG
MQEEIEVKDGKRRTVERHIFPGYVLVNMALTEESWYVVRNTPGVTGFVGMGNSPPRCAPRKWHRSSSAWKPIRRRSRSHSSRVSASAFDGPFNDFRGVVAEIDMERTQGACDGQFLRA